MGLINCRRKVFRHSKREIVSTEIHDKFYSVTSLVLGVQGVKTRILLRTKSSCLSLAGGLKETSIVLRDTVLPVKGEIRTPS